MSLNEKIIAQVLFPKGNELENETTKRASDRNTRFWICSFESAKGEELPSTTPELLNELLFFLAPVVQKLDNTIHRINHYPADKY